MSIKLGDFAEDEVTGFKGVVMSKHVYLQGCARVSLQPRVGKDGTFPEPATFDEPQLKILKVGAYKRKAVFADPGGPEKYMDEGR